MSFGRQSYLGLMCGWLAVAAVAETGTVTATLLNVRAGTGLHYEKLCQLPNGQQIEVLERSGDWYGIRCPTNAAAWVPAEQVASGRIVGGRVDVHSGPAAIFTVYARLPEGTTIVELENRDDKWLRIEPPADAIVWVHGNYVDLATAAGSTPEPAAEAIPPLTVQVAAAFLPPAGDDDSETVSEANDVTETVADEAVAPAQVVPAAGTGEAPPPPPPVVAEDELAAVERPDPATVKIHQIAPQPIGSELNVIGEAVEINKFGVVLPLAGRDTPWAYALAVHLHDTYYPLAYLAAGDTDLARWEWRKVRVIGTQRWIEGWPRPLIEVASLEPYQPPAP